MGVAAQLIDYWMEEAKVVYVIYQVWGEGFVGFLREKGVSDAEIDAEIERLSRLLAHPDGTAFGPKPSWEAIGSSAGLLANRLRGYETTAEEARRPLIRSRSAGASSTIAAPTSRPGC